jgi:hypothetical protein
VPSVVWLNVVVAVVKYATAPVFTVRSSTVSPAVNTRLPVIVQVLAPAAMVQLSRLATPFLNSVSWIESPAGTAAPNVRLAFVKPPVDPIVATLHVLDDVLTQAVESETKLVLDPAGIGRDSFSDVVAVVLNAVVPVCTNLSSTLSPAVSPRPPVIVHVFAAAAMLQVDADATPLTISVTTYELLVGTLAPNVKVAFVSVPVEPIVASLHVASKVLVQADASET